MKQPFYFFDQLFEKMSNGQYREREKPEALDPNRHFYSKDSKTGKFIVLWYVPLPLEIIDHDKKFKIDPMDWFDFSLPTYGGWGSSMSCHHCGAAIVARQLCYQCGFLNVDPVNTCKNPTGEFHE